MTGDLAVWLRAQLDNDETLATQSGTRSCWRVAFTLADITAKRTILRRLAPPPGEYTAWDQERHLGGPPWNPHDPALIAWEKAHGHDVRLKCYPEFGCQFAGDEDVQDLALDVLRLLAQPYAGRPGWHNEWTTT